MVITEASDDVVSTRVSDMQENMSSDRNAVKKESRTPLQKTPGL
ncbi:hypothetical protein G944_02270 [Escherichia coli UMEA 3215-1]|uniref:Uncharacterized protein n=1 Tax=Escherichia coli KTE182 TaxID=1181728 RepID=S1PH15_ECOLX|nr:hypothetical protein A15K_02258 [Escherichia coli KTE205]ELI59468.1 hypothetical protein WIS_02366 [Escherichia coli KTE129]ELJ71014.1 hypothetical protein WGO_02317 [Escherichia coli KTE85]EOW97438.1 hypothetical protein A13A_02306 [Escherichia coli KTE182]EQY15650.1 hypothetical protein G944_02270 [Escherichia coli UMEA 3215-1]GCY51030.1 hypothetical protein HmCmsJML079_00972 [Escherichia coli]